MAPYDTFTKTTLKTKQSISKRAGVIHIDVDYDEGPSSSRLSRQQDEASVFQRQGEEGGDRNERMLREWIERVWDVVKVAVGDDNRDWMRFSELLLTLEDHARLAR